MNYIKRLKKEGREKDAKIEALENGLRGLLSYIDSEKFRTGELRGYVNVADITLRVRETFSAAEEATEEAVRKFEEDEATKRAEAAEEAYDDHGDEYRGSC